MRIVFDARAVQERSDGMGHYARHLLISLLRLDANNEYVVLLNRFFRDELACRSLLDRPNVRAVLSPIPFLGPSQQVHIPRLLRQLPPADLYHYPHFDLPIAAHPNSVVTIYDLNQFSFSGYYDSLQPLKQLYSFATTWLSLAKAHHVFVISDWTKQQILSHFRWVDPQNITVTYLCVSDAFQAPPEPEAVAAFRARRQLDRDRFILYVGTPRPHKNLARLFAAFARLRREGIPHKLLLVGVPPEHVGVRRMISALQLDGSVRLLGYVADRELSLAYRIAEVFAFCSLSEGFGIPLVEAMASGVPIVTSNVGAMAEIVGESAVLVDPESVESIAEGLSRVLDSEPLRRQLSARGHERVQQFAWEATAQKTLEVYTRVAAKLGRCVSMGRDAAQDPHPLRERVADASFPL